MNLHIISILKQFDLTGSIAEAEPFGSGHIHQTFLVQTIESDKPDYILQKINHHVFNNVDLLMTNMMCVTNHLQQKLSGNNTLKVLILVQTRNGKAYYEVEAGNYWRMFHYIPGSKSYDSVANSGIALEAGKAFGQFIALLSDLPVHTIKPVIPEFHSLANRFRQFEAALQADAFNKRSMAKNEIGFIYEWRDEMMQIPRLESEGKFPVRITHNDTKINNVLFNAEDNAVCVIDLDTVMPGLVLYDFGDAIRTAATTAPEDEPDLNKINLNLETFESFASGFIQSAKSILTDNEIAYLAFSCRYITYIQALRFLTDFLDGDQYYSTRYANHNLIRTKAQIKLAQSMKEKEVIMNDIVMRICNCIE